VVLIIYIAHSKIRVQATVEDANLRETSTLGNPFGDNVALFSDEILKPNGGNPLLSWGTGYGTVKPLVYNKLLYNLQTNSNIGVSADTMVGVAYLDKGLIVITDPTIIVMN
jgi:hypothetical protein